MTMIWTEDEKYKRAEYESEKDLEGAILTVKDDFLGGDRIYLDVKKKIGKRGGQRNIPDGYLIDLMSKTPKLYVVENELASHDPLRHIAVQLLQFSLSFEEKPRAVKKILHEALKNNPAGKKLCEQYADENNFRNLDYLLEYMVFEDRFSALVIIDEIPEKLENVLMNKLGFGVGVIELARYVNDEGDQIYRFKPFLEDVIADIKQGGEEDEKELLALTEVDTIVVPANEEGFKEVFLEENRWYKIRINGSMIPQIKHIAVYQTAPVSAITHVAPVESIEPWKDTDKYVVNFAQPAEKIDPIKYEGQMGQYVQAPRYTIYERLKKAETLSDLWYE
jgi:hypothetical protein